MMLLKKIDETVIKETKYIAVWVVLLSIVMQAVFLVIGKWHYSVALGNLLAATVVILNFLFMGITVQNAIEKDEKDAKSTMKVSQSLRSLFLFVAVVVGVVAPCFNTISVVIPMFFPRIAVAIRPYIKNKGADMNEG